MSAQATIAKKKRRWAPADQPVMWMVLLLSAVGVVAVASAATFIEQTKMGGSEGAMLYRHVARLAIGLILLLVFSQVDYHRAARWGKSLIVAAAVLLIFVKLAGVASGGATRWIRLGTFGFQPSDFAKIALLLHLSQLLARKQAYIEDFHRGFIPVVIWIGLVALLIGLENLSTAVLVLATSMAVCFVGRVRVKHLSLLVPAGALLAILMLLFSPARAARVESYLGTKIFSTTEAQSVFNQQDEGYQSTQAKIAFAMGGISGVGPGKSVQRDFLPAPFNDFIFAIIAEEYGIAIALCLLAVFVALLFRGFLRIARNAPDPLGLFLAVGITTMISLYAFVHAGVCIGLLPVTGLPMPFVSYGGSALFSGGVLMGMLLNVSKQCPLENTVEAGA